MRDGAWGDVEALRGPELVDRLLANLQAIVRAAQAKGQEDDAILASLPEALRVLWHLDALDAEVAQGSLLAYFMNSTGRHAQHAILALRSIGAEGMAEVVQHARAVVERNRSEWSERRAELNDVTEFSIVHPYQGLAGADELDALTDAYWRAAESDTWGDKLERYLESHRGALAEWAAG